MGISFSARGHWFADARCIVCKGRYEFENGETCDACPHYGFVPATGDPGFDMAYGNAALVLSALGFAMDDEGSVLLNPADVLVAINQVRGRAGEFARETTRDWNMVSCGYSAEVIEDRFERFARLAHYALEEGVEIVGN